jgi:TolA-binding protein
MLTSKRNKTSPVWLGMASVIFALAIAPTNAKAQKQTMRSQTASSTTQDPRTAVNICTGDRALEARCLKERLDKLEETVNSMSSQLEAIQGALNTLNSNINKIQDLIGEPKSDDNTIKNLWQAVSKLNTRLAQANIP